MPLTDPSDENQDESTPFDFQRTGHDSAFGELPRDERQRIRRELAGLRPDEETLRQNFSQMRRAAEEVDVVQVEQKIKTLEAMSSDDEDFRRAKDEVWLDLYILKQIRGESDDAVVWLQKQYSQID